MLSTALKRLSHPVIAQDLYHAPPIQTLSSLYFLSLSVLPVVLDVETADVVKDKKRTMGRNPEQGDLRFTKLGLIRSTLRPQRSLRSLSRQYILINGVTSMNPK